MEGGCGVRGENTRCKEVPQPSNMYLFGFRTIIQAMYRISYARAHIPPAVSYSIAQQEDMAFTRLQLARLYMLDTAKL
jgi:glycerol uptake facilitator-like aquaporin